MASVYTVLMHSIAGQNGLHTLSPPDGSVVWIIRDIDVYAGNAGVSPIHLRFRNDAGGTLWLVQVDPDTNLSASWRGRQVSQFGAPFDVLTDAPFDVTVSGYQLSLP